MERETRRQTTRRQFIKGIAAAAGVLVASQARPLLGDTPSTSAQQPDWPYRYYLPLVTSNHPPSGQGAKVIHVHATQATYWDFGNNWYGSYVRQDVVDAMMERGLMELAATPSVAQAWATILPQYQAGQKIAVKVNFNNSKDNCADTDNAIDALIEPVNALIRTLVQAGIRAEDVWVYDAIRWIPERFFDRRQHPQASYFDRGACTGHQQATFNHIDASLRVSFSNPGLVTARWLTDLLYQATYLINMPIIKKHSAIPVTLGFKNHFGSLDNLGGGGDDNPHLYVNPSDGHYRSNLSPFVDIYANPNIGGKTVLTIGDGLFGAPSVGAKPIPWNTLAGAANSLFFSRDPVAIDCVMSDLLRAEWGVNEAVYDYLRVAEERGLGTFERGDPWGSGYTTLDYRRLEL